MLYHNSFRSVFIALVTLLGCLIAASPSKVLAQGVDRGKRQDGIHVFKGGGRDRSVGRRPGGPTSLTALDLKKLAGMVGSAPGSVYVKLSPQEPSATNRGVLVFVNPKLVETGLNYATWGPSGNINFQGAQGSLMLWLRPATGSKYLIDCAVESSSPNAHFVVTGPNGTAPFDVKAIAGGQHLTFVLEATDNKWQPFQLTGTGTKSQYGISSDVEWTFYSCEVTNL
jgi:hypothetical protein